jgi:hypothetical protein
MILAAIFLFIAIEITPQQSCISKGVNNISAYIASYDFGEISPRNSDIALTDSIFLFAKQLYNDNISEALLALTFAAVPYRYVPVRVPLLNLMIHYPLISAEENIFNLKNRQLPSKLFFDTPSGDYGDKDKLAHFFGSAYLAYLSLIFDFAPVIGYFVEVFEEKFQVQSSVDLRDMEANRLGILFGKMLKKNYKTLPSDILILNTLLHLRIQI